MEHIFHQPQFEEDWFNYAELYRRIVQNCRADGKIVEVGSWKGKSTSFLLVEAWNKSPQIEIYAVDTWAGSPEQQNDPHVISGTLYDKFLANVKPVSRQLVPLRLTSLQGANFFPDQSLDAVFIDASHDYENVKADILAWLPKVRSKGILSGHDYDFNWPGVEKAVQETLPKIELVGNCWVHCVP